jgi:type I restriction enzyme R subunit
VLAYIACAKEPITRDLRAAHAKTSIHNTFNAKQEAFIDFVLAQYVNQGVEKLDSDKRHHCCV